MKKELVKIIKKAFKTLFPEENFEDENFSLETPKNEHFGDFSTNLAMVLAKKIKKNPLEIAEKIAKGIRDEKIDKVEVANPGYINIFLNQKFWQDLLVEINKAGNNFGNSDMGKGIKISNEFISANPTGPLHLGNGRGGFYGDSLGRVFKKAGFEVANEYYINDAGGQIEKLGHSIIKDDAACYSGDYIDELNKKYGGLSLNEAGEKAAEEIVENIIKKTVKDKMNINYDLWISEKDDVLKKGYAEKAIKILEEKNLTYKKDGALWFKTTNFGDDKDRVLVKSDGKNAYFASDCGYFLHKIERKFNKMILILGADHHGYIKRMHAAAKALGFTGDFKFIVSQLVRLVKNGKEVRMSKRAGNVVYIDELIDKVGHDVARFFFLMYSPDTHMNFDLGIAEERSQKNPVFYVQYAHARIYSILEKAKKGGINFEKADVSKINDEKEKALIRELSLFPELIEEISQNLEIHKLTHYSIKIADKLHSFYNSCLVIDKENIEISRARLKLINAVRIVLEETLDLIGVGAPDKM